MMATGGIVSLLHNIRLYDGRVVRCGVIFFHKIKLTIRSVLFYYSLKHPSIQLGYLYRNNISYMDISYSWYIYLFKVSRSSNKEVILSFCRYEYAFRSTDHEF